MFGLMLENCKPTLALNELYSFFGAKLTNVAKHTNVGRQAMTSSETSLNLLVGNY